jgi:hypothetical protein
LNGRRAIDITGQRFGLVVVEYRAGTNAQGYPLWMVRCDCGQRRLARGCVLRQNPPTTHRACPSSLTRPVDPPEPHVTSEQQGQASGERIA